MSPPWGTRVWSALRLPLFRLFGPIAGHIQFQYHTVMNQPIDRRRRGHRVFEDSFPFAKRQIAGYRKRSGNHTLLNGSDLG